MTEDQIRALIESIVTDKFAKMLAPKQGESSMTRKEFCDAEHMSLSTYHKMRKMGLGPEEVTLPGMSFTRITQDARRDWHTRIEEWRRSQASKLERERRSESARTAGKIAIKSALHVTKQNPKPKPQKRR